MRSFLSLRRRVLAILSSCSLINSAFGCMLAKHDLKRKPHPICALHHNTCCSTPGDRGGVRTGPEFELRNDRTQLRTALFFGHRRHFRRPCAPRVRLRGNQDICWERSSTLVVRKNAAPRPSRGTIGRNPGTDDRGPHSCYASLMSLCRPPTGDTVR